MWRASFRGHSSKKGTTTGTTKRHPTYFGEAKAIHKLVCNASSSTGRPPKQARASTVTRRRRGIGVVLRSGFGPDLPLLASVAAVVSVVWLVWCADCIYCVGRGRVRDAIELWAGGWGGVHGKRGLLGIWALTVSQSQSLWVESGVSSWCWCVLCFLLVCFSVSAKCVVTLACIMGANVCLRC